MRLHETIDFRSKATLYNFIEWWKERAGTSFPGGEDVQNNSKFLQKIQVEADGTINCALKIHIIDHKSTFLPFKFGKVQAMRLQMHNLQSLHNAPTDCPMFTVEASQSMRNDKLKSLIDCPQKSDHMAFELGSPLENLECSLKAPCESLWIHTPEIKSFAGLPQPIGNISFVLSHQKSISHIKQLRHVQLLDLMLPSEFQGGLLGVCLIPGLIGVNGGGEKTKGQPWSEALKLIGDAMKQKQNVHDVQETLIEAGFSKFARL